MNLSTKCNCCAKEDVCKHKNEYTSAVNEILESTWEVASGGFVRLKDSDIVSVTIKCEKFMAHVQTPRGEIK